MRIRTALAVVALAGAAILGGAGAAAADGPETGADNGTYTTDSGYKTGASYHHNRWFDLDN